MTVFIVAEAGVNHQGDRAKMLALCDAAKAAGADAVKFQAYDTWALAKRRGMTTPVDGALVSPNITVSDAQQVKHEHLKTFGLLSRAELSDADLDAIAAHCKSIGIKWFASVFSPDQIERVLSRGACALKIGNNESEWEELKGACRDAQKKTTRGSKSATEAWLRELPVWISGDADDCNVAGSWKYPANGEEPMLRSVGNQYRGYSSHFTDYRIPAAAALRGAEYIEAHLCLGMPAHKYGTESWNEHYKEQYASKEPEAAWSLSPDDFASMVKLIREYESWL